MIMSSASSRLLRLSTVSSVVRPAGNINQTTRGFFPTVFTTSASDAAAVAPSFASPSRALALRANTTQWCPAFIRRRDMLSPILPSPIMPICIRPLPLFAHANACRPASLSDAKPPARTEMDAQDPPVAFGQHFEFLVRHLEIGGVVAGDLQEHAGIRASLVGLPWMRNPPAQGEVHLMLNP